MFTFASLQKAIASRMKQSILMKHMVALMVCLTATSCHKDISSGQEQMTEGFKALVMGGKDIDPNQTWSTASGTPVSISVNLQAAGEYTVYVYQAHPAAGGSYLGMVTLASGESKTIQVAKPNDASQLFAACYDAQNRVVCMPVVDGQVTFSGSVTTTTGIPAISTGNNWSIPFQTMPDLSKYTAGALTEVTDLDTNLAEDAEAHLKVSQDYSGFIPFLATHTNMSVYVTSTWTLTFDQRINSGNVIVVGSGGKIVVPKGFSLTTTPLGGATAMGRIYVMPGGEISGEGTVEFSSEGSGYNYNGGTVAAGEVAVTGGALYNGGTIGNGATKLTGAASAATPAQFVNLASANLSAVDGSTLSLMNGGTINVSGNLTLANDSRMDDGSSIRCGSLTLQGNGSSTLYMGNASYLNCTGSISVSNYGVWGPSGSKYTANARFRVGGCSQCSATSGNANSYLLDHVQLEVPKGATGLDLLSGWMNGAAGGIDSGRQTCFYQMEGTQAKPGTNYIFYAFEVPDNYGVRDYDYNDLVLCVSPAYDNGDGTYTISVNVAAIGSPMELTVLYNGQDFGKEAHEAMGVSTSASVNTSTKSLDPQVLGMITVSDPNIAVDRLSFSLRRKHSSGSTTTLTQSSDSEDAPLYIAVSGDANGKWKWPKEGSNIGLAYKLFSTWASNAQTALDWYTTANASSTRIVSW